MTHVSFQDRVLLSKVSNDKTEEPFRRPEQEEVVTEFPSSDSYDSKRMSTLGSFVEGRASGSDF